MTRRSSLSSNRPMKALKYSKKKREREKKGRCIWESGEDDCWYLFGRVIKSMSQANHSNPPWANDDSFICKPQDCSSSETVIFNEDFIFRVGGVLWCEDSLGILGPTLSTSKMWGEEKEQLFLSVGTIPASLKHHERQQQLYFINYFLLACVSEKQLKVNLTAAWTPVSFPLLH